MTPRDPFYADSPDACENRRAKATALSTWCLAEEYDPAAIVDPRQRRQIERAAGVRRSSPQTWELAVTLYDRARA